ncbi:MAG TPA: DUF1444 family protein [Steroidobacteraceae bacterium]|nr:DUF1444 family protein [Steroidobacteraceae bacterium]
MSISKKRTLSPWPIAALTLVSSLTAIAGDIPADETGFTNYVAGLFRAEIGDSVVVVKSPLALGVGNLQANLDRVYTFCRQNADRCSIEIDTYVKGAVQVYRDQMTPPTREAIRLVVRTTQYVQNSQAVLRPDAPSFLPQPFVPGLVLLPVLDSPRTLRLLNTNDLKTLGLTTEELQQLALSNLRTSLKPLMDVAKVAGHGQIGQLVGDTFQPSRLALLDAWAPLAAAQGGKLIVALPATDALFYIGEDTQLAIDALRALVRNLMSRAPGPLSNILLRWTPTGWEIVT